MKKILPICLSLLFCSCSSVPTNDITADETLKKAIKWYRNSAEKKALYLQIFSMGYQYIYATIKKLGLKPKTWGVVLDMDETVLDNSAIYFKFSNCFDGPDIDQPTFEKTVTIHGKANALPGAVELTKKIHELGGYVSFVTNRDGSYKDAEGNTLDKVVETLRNNGIYFDQVILANYRDCASPTDTDKNPRFKAIEDGNYNPKLMIWSNTLPPHKIIAYFGDNIHDFPCLKQADIVTKDGNSKEFDKFGHGFFILPNPMYGSWEENYYE